MKFNTKTSFHIWFGTGNNSLWKQLVDIQFNIASFWGPLSLKYIPLFRCCAAFYSLHSLMRAYSKFAPSDTCFAMRHWRKSSANSFSGIFNEKFRKCLMKLFLLYYCKLYCHHNLKGGGGTNLQSWPRRISLVPASPITMLPAVNTEHSHITTIQNFFIWFVLEKGKYS